MPSRDSVWQAHSADVSLRALRRHPMSSDTQIVSRTEVVSHRSVQEEIRYSSSGTQGNEGVRAEPCETELDWV